MNEITLPMNRDSTGRAVEVSVSVPPEEVCAVHILLIFDSPARKA